MLGTELLANVSIFGGLADDELVNVRALLEERVADAGSTVVVEGSPGRELFVIEEGTAEVWKRGANGEDLKLCELGPGACFGEVALIGIMPRSATVRAVSPLRLLVLPYARIGRLQSEHPQTFTMLVMNLAREVCRRLQRADKVLLQHGVIKPL